jgi:hypothetical protein
VRAVIPCWGEPEGALPAKEKGRAAAGYVGCAPAGGKMPDLPPEREEGEPATADILLRTGKLCKKEVGRSHGVGGLHTGITPDVPPDQ